MFENEKYRAYREDQLDIVGYGATSKEAKESLEEKEQDIVSEVYTYR